MHLPSIEMPWIYIMPALSRRGTIDYLLKDCLFAAAPTDIVGKLK